jgi:1-acyl-sn-glycerol-3-phosphate acyltransferase
MNDASSIRTSNGGRAIDPTRPSLMWRILRMPARFLVCFMWDLKVYGRRHVPERGGVLLLANHQSYLDPVLIAVYLQRPVSYLAKSELFHHRWFSWLIRSLNAFPVKQGAGDIGAVKETIKRLREGHILNVYPEGSRTSDGRIGPMQPGAALVVRKAGVPVVPVVIEGSFHAYPRNSRLFRSGRISVMYGPAMDLRGLDARQVTQKIDQTLRSMHAQLCGIMERRRRRTL